jgi:protein SCO1/2
MCLFLLLLLHACKQYQYKGSLIVDPPTAANFTLNRSDGGQLHLSDLQGKIVLLFFGFATCPDVCPTTLSDAKQIFEELDEEAGNVAYLFITVDPERDTPEVLDAYVSNFHENIIGLTGTEAELAAVREDYGVYAAKVPLKSSIGYTMEHTARVYLIDAEGRLRLTYAFGTPYEDILQDIRHILKELDNPK